MKENYEILKEHELTIIKGCQLKTKEAKLNLNAKIDKLNLIIEQKDKDANERFNLIRNQEDQIRLL
jgi:hypothetical protein